MWPYRTSSATSISCAGIGSPVISLRLDSDARSRRIDSRIAPPRLLVSENGPSGSE